MIDTNLRNIYYPRGSAIFSPSKTHNQYCISLVLKLLNNQNNLP